ncbi:hypothetical protein SPIROBIBN47_210189 [uncultured spirochete]|uniref:Uncharacterized protein n=1 Tax=uncultured spirochete TaxID=156406 RepID=A0A3P3XHN6_9SPIR|nr:hypothetical protein SPIROBIBN47_210189 [uncultured spirochete]
MQHRNPYFGTIGDIEYLQPIINAIGDFGNSDSRISLIFMIISF